MFALDNDEPSSELYELMVCLRGLGCKRLTYGVLKDKLKFLSHVSDNTTYVDGTTKPRFWRETKTRHFLRLAVNRRLKVLFSKDR